METSTKSFVALLIAIAIAFASAALTFYALSGTQCQPPKTNIKIPGNSYDYLEKYHDPIRKITAIKALATGKCFILTNDEEFSTQPRALRILNEAYPADLFKTVAGEGAVEFCGEMQPIPVELVQEQDGIREKRQSTGEDKKKLEATKARLSQNECQNNQIIDCGKMTNGGVYQCKTGPGQAYAGKVECKSATTFTFNIKSRCAKCTGTKKNRLTKCIQNFVLGQAGTCDD